MADAVAADVAVIGAGCAGLAAAVTAAASGRRVVVLEEAPRIGGRATSFVDRVTGERVDNGQHAIFGCYTATYAYLAQLGVAHLAPLQPALTLTMADDAARVATLACPSLPPPLHLAAGLLRWRAVPLRARASALRLLGLLRRVRRDGAAAVADAVPSHLTVAGWLAMQRQSPDLCRWLWHPLAIAALNQRPDVAAAAPFVRVLGELFGPDRRAAAIGMAAVPLDELLAAPAERYLEARGGRIIRGASARVWLDEAGRIAGARAREVTIAAPCVVSAVPWHAFGRLWDGAVPQPLQAIARDAAAMASSPIVTVNLWFDEDVSRLMPAPIVGLVGEPMHWVFDKRAIVGAGATHLSVVASGADELTDMENGPIVQTAIAQLARSLPGVAGQRLRHSVVVREHRATFSLAPGGPPRPGPVTRLSSFLLAGDWTNTGLPGTIEGAIRGGRACFPQS